MDFNQIEEGREDNQEENIVFHYNRDERIKKAPSIVKDYYNGTLKAFKPGLFKALVATKANRLMLFALAICFSVVIFVGIFNKKNENTLCGIPLKLTAFSFEETVYASLNFDNAPPSKKNSDVVNTIVEMDFLDLDNQIVHKETFAHVYRGEETFLRTTFRDYDILNVEAIVLIGDESTKLRCAVEKR